MAERQQNPRPIVGCAAGFDPDHRRRKRLEESHHLLAPQLLAQNHLLGGVHPVKLEKMFRRVHPNLVNLFHGRSPLSEICNDLILAQSMPSGAVHTNNEMKIAPRSVRIAVGASSRSAANCMVASRLGDKQPHSARMSVVIRRLMGSRKLRCGCRPDRMAGKTARTGKQSTYAPVWSTGVMGTARWKGDAGNRGRPVWIGGRGFNTALGGGLGGRRTAPCH